MIGRLVGKLAEFNGTNAVIDVQGVGYEVESPLGTYADVNVGDECTLYVHLSILQDAHSLYAFPNKPMREFFRVLIKVPGIGPKSAISMLAAYSVSDLIRIVNQRDIGALTRAKGIGKKTAERILVDLSDKVEGLPYELVHATGDSSAIRTDAETALMQLGFRQFDANQAISAVWHDGIELEPLIRGALQQLAHTP